MWLDVQLPAQLADITDALRPDPGAIDINRPCRKIGKALIRNILVCYFLENRTCPGTP